MQIQIKWVAIILTLVFIGFLFLLDHLLVKAEKGIYKATVEAVIEQCYGEGFVIKTEEGEAIMKCKSMTK